MTPYAALLLCSGLSVCATSQAQTSTPAPLYPSNYGALCNGLADDTAALKSALAAAQKTARPLWITGTCTTSQTLSVPGNIVIDGRGTGKLKTIGISGRLLSLQNVSNVTVQSLTLDGNYPKASINYGIQVDNSSNVQLRNLTLINPGNGIGVTGGSQNVVVTGATVTNSHVHGIDIDSSTNITVSNSTLEGQVGFGIWVRGQASQIRLTDNTTHKSGLELIGATRSTSNLSISGNYAANTGDNCYSLTGHYITFTGNTGIGCAGNGVAIYGHHVTVTGNYLRNNSQAWRSNGGWLAGIMIIGGWGGTGQHNTVTRNIVEDDQKVPTQQYGILIPSFTPYTWTPGVALPAGSYRVQGLNIYQTTNGGNTGTRPPTHTSGTASDGNLVWLYVDSYERSTRPDFNVIQNNQSGRAAIAAVADHSLATSNQVRN